MRIEKSKSLGRSSIHFEILKITSGNMCPTKKEAQYIGEKGFEVKNINFQILLLNAY